MPLGVEVARKAGRWEMAAPTRSTIVGEQINAAARQLLAGAGVDGLHLDSVVGLRIDVVETDGLRFACCRIKRYRTGNEGQA